MTTGTTHNKTLHQNIQHPRRHGNAVVTTALGATLITGAFGCEMNTTMTAANLRAQVSQHRLVITTANKTHSRGSRTKDLSPLAGALRQSDQPDRENDCEGCKTREKMFHLLEL